ncbi:MAG: glycoside hydrolase family 88 protein [Treponema sp.]|jgi:rhamnogalacturonyl hydrolase YesR|nr:glycoside hydrolase family 88 protein [Treponema sp.]
MINNNDTVTKVKLALLAMQRHSWEQGTAMQAFLEQGDMEIVIPMAKEAVYRKRPDGRTADIGNTSAVTDPCAVGEALIAACKTTGDAVLKKGCDELLEWALKKAPRNDKGVVYHLDNVPQIWSDSTYMLPPFLAAAGYFDEALINLYGVWDVLFNTGKKLMSHIWDDGVKNFIREAYWGGGNGWTLAAIARIYDLLSEKRGTDREKLAVMGKTLIDGILAHVRTDFLFHDVIDDSGSFVETNLSQMLAYTIYRAVHSKWLDRSYLETAEKLYAAAVKKIDAYGLVQDCCGAPSFDKAGVAPEGQAFYLLMEAARSKLIQ